MVLAADLGAASVLSYVLFTVFSPKIFFASSGYVLLLRSISKIPLLGAAFIPKILWKVSASLLLRGSEVSIVEILLLGDVGSCRFLISVVFGRFVVESMWAGFSRVFGDLNSCIIEPIRGLSDSMMKLINSSTA